MKRILSAAFAAVLAVALNGVMVSDAEARRMGGGSSSGMKRDSSIMKRDTAPTQNTTTSSPTQAAKPAPAATPAAAPAQRSGMSRWMGPIAGLAAGLGLAALFSHLGLGEGMANIVMILLLVVAAVVVFRLIFGRKKQAAQPMQFAGAGNGAPFQPQAQSFQAEQSYGGSQAPVAGAVPEGFDAAGFLRQAKLNFVRLQAANDRGDMADIKNFTGPELFAEIQMQYEERGRAAQQTDVVQLDADLLDVSIEGNQEIASVRFHGQIRETANGAPEYFNEVWHLARPRDNSRGWVVAGIQQAE